MCCTRGESGKETFWSQTSRNWKKMDTSEIHPRRINAKEVLTPMSGEKVIFPIADGTVKLSRGGQALRTSTLIRDSPDRGEEQEHLLGESDGVFITFSSLIVGWLWSKKRFLVHFRELHLPSSRWTESQTARAERRIIPNSTTIHWRDQSDKYDLGCDAWTPHRRVLEYRRKPRPIRFVDWGHTIHHIGRRTSRWVYMVRGATDEETNDIQAWLLVPQIWIDMSEAAQRKENQKWCIEKPKFDSATHLHNVHFIDLADAECKETIQNARREFEVPMPAAMLCKIRGRKYKETCRTPDARKTKFACIVEGRGVYEKAFGRNST